MKHVRYEHVNCRNETCGYCLGGLFTCAVCGASEGELPTDCPGVKMTTQQLDETYRGLLNYKGTKWVRSKA